MISRPWLRAFPFGRLRAVPGLLLVAGWTASGAALWAVAGVGAWQTARRPPVVAEAFVSDDLPPSGVEALAESVRARPFCCEARPVSAEEARAEGQQDERVRKLLDAYGGNPFLRSIRVTLCPAAVGEWREVETWLEDQEGVTSVRLPEARLAVLLAGEAAQAASARATAACAAAGGILVVLCALALLAAEAEAELDLYERLGARPLTVWARLLVLLPLPALATALFAGIGLEVAGVLLGVAPAWVPAGWLPAGVPGFPLDSAGLLVGLAVTGACAVATALFVRRLTRSAV
ncbi:MAG: hypothetical protein AAB368_00865 [bacterium]